MIFDLIIHTGYSYLYALSWYWCQLSGKRQRASTTAEHAFVPHQFCW